MLKNKLGGGVANARKCFSPRVSRWDRSPGRVIGGGSRRSRRDHYLLERDVIKLSVEGVTNRYRPVTFTRIGDAT